MPVDLDDDINETRPLYLEPDAAPPPGWSERGHLVPSRKARAQADERRAGELWGERGAVGRGIRADRPAHERGCLARERDCYRGGGARDHEVHVAHTQEVERHT